MALAREIIPADEPQIIGGLIRDNLKTVWKDGATAKRGQHGKHHGLAEGTVRVLDDLPDHLAKGVFQPGRAYSCLVRFSNGGQQDDTEADVRGMAIKLLEVEGVKLLPGRGHIREHDFILVDHPTYFTATMADYAAFNRHFTPVQDLRSNGFSLPRLVRAGQGLVNLLLFHRNILKAAKAFASRRPGSVLSLTYHSTTPYLLGDGQAVKYKAVGKAPDAGPTEDKDGLGKTLWTSLTKSPAVFDFGVVMQTDAASHPIEDPTIDWEANGAQFIKLAELILETQDRTERKDKLAEEMHFNPWISLADHRPLGFINRARREIYAAMSGRRRRIGDRPGEA
jgi:hypothetical protein